MKSKKWNFIMYIHAGLLLWALLFLSSLLIPDGGEMARILGIGNVLFLLLNIPLGALSFVLKKKGRLDAGYKTPITVLSGLNLIIGAVAWVFLVLVLQLP